MKERWICLYKHDLADNSWYPAWITRHMKNREELKLFGNFSKCTQNRHIIMLIITELYFGLHRVIRVFLHHVFVKKTTTDLWLWIKEVLSQESAQSWSSVCLLIGQTADGRRWLDINLTYQQETNLGSTGWVCVCKQLIMLNDWSVRCTVWLDYYWCMNV